MNILLIILWLTLKPPGLWLGKPDEAKAIVNTNCAVESPFAACDRRLIGVWSGNAPLGGIPVN